MIRIAVDAVPIFPVDSGPMRGEYEFSAVEADGGRGPSFACQTTDPACAEAASTTSFVICYPGVPPACAPCFAQPPKL